jgi:hypothetical protein
MANNNRGHVPEVQRCKGTSRQSGERCKRRHSPGSEYCIFHGGRAPKGGAHPNFKHGKHSKYRPPPELLENFEAFLRDPELAHHRNSVAILDAMLQDLFDNYDSAASPALWRKLRSAWGQAEAAREAGDERAWRAAHGEVGLIIERGVAQSGREGRAVSLLEQRRRHADSELKRETAEKHTWTYEEAAAFYIALGEAVRKHVPDREQLTRIDQDLAALVGRAAPESARRTPGSQPG